MADNNFPAGLLEHALTDDETRKRLERPSNPPMHPEEWLPKAVMTEQNRSLTARRRDALAAAAVQGILAHQGAQLSDAQVQQVAAQSVRVADALLLELDKVKAR